MIIKAYAHPTSDARTAANSSTKNAFNKGQGRKSQRSNGGTTPPKSKGGTVNSNK